MSKRFMDAYRTYHTEYEKMATDLFDYDITPTELLALSVADGKSRTEIAEALRVTLPQITFLTRELERHHYVTIRSGTEDRRQRFCIVTKKGKNLLERIGANE
jgi:DNA-binding MarR family transcriptional regulator